MSTRGRRGIVVVLLAGVAGLWWAWPSTSDEVSPPSPSVDPSPSPPVAAEVSRVEPAPPAPVVIAAVPDAGEPDAGLHSWRTSFLKEGNQPFRTLESQAPWMQICRREGNACATHELFWDAPPEMVAVELAPSAYGVVVTGLGKLRVGGNERFWACFERAMKAAPMVGVERNLPRMCSFEQLRTPLNDPEELVEKISNCLGPVTTAKSVTLTWELAVTGEEVEVQRLEITSDGALDGYAQRCIRQAASPSPIRFNEDTRPPFSRRAMKLTVMTFSQGGPSNQPRDPATGKIPSFPELTYEPLTAAQRYEGDALVADIRVARDAFQHEKVIELSARCIEKLPMYPACYRLLGSAAALLAGRQSSQLYMRLAERAYVRFLEVAPPDDPYVPKVAAILDGGT